MVGIPETWWSSEELGPKKFERKIGNLGTEKPGMKGISITFDRENEYPSNKSKLYNLLLVFMTNRGQKKKGKILYK